MCLRVPSHVYMLSGRYSVIYSVIYMLDILQNDLQYKYLDS